LIGDRRRRKGVHGPAGELPSEFVPAISNETLANSTTLGRYVWRSSPVRYRRSPRRTSPRLFWFTPDNFATASRARRESMARHHRPPQRLIGPNADVAERLPDRPRRRPRHRKGACSTLDPHQTIDGGGSLSNSLIAERERTRLLRPPRRQESASRRQRASLARGGIHDFFNINRGCKTAWGGRGMIFIWPARPTTEGNRDLVGNRNRSWIYRELVAELGVLSRLRLGLRNGTC